MTVVVAMHRACKQIGKQIGELNVGRAPGREALRGWA